MKRIYLIISLLIVLCFQEIQAQVKKWSLEDCITYAVTNNIGLKRQMLQTESAEVNLLKSKMDILPSLNFQSNANIQYGRSVDPISNGITFLQNLTNYYDLSSNIRLFNGFTILNTISANKFMLKAGLEEEKIVRNTLIINIMGQYYQVLYSRGLENASKMQLELSEKQLFRITKMVETGKEALSRQYEIESQVSTDKLSYTIAHNSASQALTILKQMLQLVPGSDFDILMPDLDNMLITDNSFNPDSIYNIASQALPRLKEIEFELKASKKQIAAAREILLPTCLSEGQFFRDTIPFLTIQLPRALSRNRCITTSDRQYFLLSIYQYLTIIQLPEILNWLKSINVILNSDSNRKKTICILKSRMPVLTITEEKTSMQLPEPVLNLTKSLLMPMKRNLNPDLSM